MKRRRVLIARVDLVPVEESYTNEEIRKLLALRKEPGGKTFGSMDELLKDLKSWSCDISGQRGFAVHFGRLIRSDKQESNTPCGNSRPCLRRENFRTVLGRNHFSTADGKFVPVFRSASSFVAAPTVWSLSRSVTMMRFAGF